MTEKWLENLFKYDRIHKQEKSKCELCNLEFSVRSGLYRHKRVVHMKKRHKCNNCDKDFSRIDLLKRHALNVHQNMKYNCDLCEKNFGRPDYLRLHKQAIHRGLNSTLPPLFFKFFSCSSCKPKKTNQHIAQISC